METYYIKKGRRYIPVGYNMPDLYDGIYYTRKEKYGRRTTNVAYWHGNYMPQPINTQLLIQVMQNDDKLASLLMKLQDAESEEFKKFKENSGGFVKEPLKIMNLSAHDLAIEILRFIYQELSSVKQVG